MKCSFCNTEIEKDHVMACPSCGGEYHIEANQCASCGLRNLVLEVAHEDEDSNVGRGGSRGSGDPADAEVLADASEKHDGGRSEVISELSEVSDVGTGTDSEGTPRTVRRRK